MNEKIGVKALKGVSVLYQDDIYDLACFLLKLDDAKDKGTNRRSRYTIYGLATVYSMIANVSRGGIIDIFKSHGLPLAATVEYDNDVT